jgi:hypothetical protein
MLLSLYLEQFANNVPLDRDEGIAGCYLSAYCVTYYIEVRNNAEY